MMHNRPAPGNSKPTGDLLKCAVLALLAAGICDSALAERAGIVTHLSGTLSVKRADAPPKTLAVNSEVNEGDVLITQDNTYARIKFSDEGTIVLRPNSEMKIRSYGYNATKPESDSAVMSIIKGSLRFVTGLIGKRNREKVDYSTSTATIGIRGTEGDITDCQQGSCNHLTTATGTPPRDGTYLDLHSGGADMSTDAGSTPVIPGQTVFAGSRSDLPRILTGSEIPRLPTLPGWINQNSPNGQGIGTAKQEECAP
ncbi:MAG TPA: FecR domain-containing protein [Rhodocyclaceae bacterium]|nr:FecR domain-containing protein [Rhodocyclaceae bacterium]